MQLHNQQALLCGYGRRLTMPGSRMRTSTHAAHGMRKASVKDFHSLRTTWITEALTRGVPIETVKRISGTGRFEVVTTHYFRPAKTRCGQRWPTLSRHY